MYWGLFLQPLCTLEGFWCTSYKGSRGGRGMGDGEGRMFRGIWKPGLRPPQVSETPPHPGFCDTLDFSSYLHVSSPLGEWSEGRSCSALSLGAGELGTTEEGIPGTSAGSFTFHLPAICYGLADLSQQCGSLETRHWLFFICLMLLWSNSPTQPSVEVFSIRDKSNPSFTLSA